MTERCLEEIKIAKVPPSTPTDRALPAPVGGGEDASPWLSGRDNQWVNHREASGHSYPIANFSCPSGRNAQGAVALSATFGSGAGAGARGALTQNGRRQRSRGRQCPHGGL